MCPTIKLTAPTDKPLHVLHLSTHIFMDSTSAVQQLTPASSDLGHTPVVVKPSSIDRSRGYEEGEPNANLRRHNKFLKLDSEMEWTFIKTTDWMSTCLTGVNSDSDTAFQPFNVTLNKNEAAMYPGLVSSGSVFSIF